MSETDEARKEIELDEFEAATHQQDSTLDRTASDSTVCPRLLLTLAAGRCRILLSLNSFKLEVSTTPEGLNLIDGLVTKTERTLDTTQES